MADSGLSALECVNELKEEIDLALVDLSMPGMSGAETARRIREMLPGMPICLMSGYSEVMAERQMVDPLVVSSFIQKPFTPEQLAQKIRSVLDSNALSES